MENVRYDNNGEAEFLGFSVDPCWGEAWVARVARKLGISGVEASRYLENGGNPLPREKVFDLLDN